MPCVRFCHTFNHVPWSGRPGTTLEQTLRLVARAHNVARPCTVQQLRAVCQRGVARLISVSSSHPPTHLPGPTLPGVPQKPNRTPLRPGQAQCGQLQALCQRGGVAQPARGRRC
eukprot:256517-Chlamydomonas_euryale.AAC.10